MERKSFFEVHRRSQKTSKMLQQEKFQSDTRKKFLTKLLPREIEESAHLENLIKIWAIKLALLRYRSDWLWLRKFPFHPQDRCLLKFCFEFYTIRTNKFLHFFLLWKHHDGICLKCYYWIYCATFTAAVQGVIKVFTDIHKQAVNYCAQDLLAD